MSAPAGIDDAFRERMISVFHADGEGWLAALPELLQEYARRWRLTLGEPFVPLSFNYVVAATRSDGAEVVLKAGVPRGELQAEVDALRHYDGRGSVRLIDADVAAGVSLIERAMPGSAIFELDDDAEATRIAARLMRRLWRPPAAGHTLPTVREWGSAFDELRARHGGGSGPMPSELFDYAESLYLSLDAGREREVVLHGDLHHWNIVSAEREPWLAIDPHGVVGDPAFEVGAWMHNPVGDAGHPDEARFLVNQPDLRQILSRRLDVFAEELGIARERLRDWSVAFAVLSACWSDESDHAEGREQAVMVAEHLRLL